MMECLRRCTELLHQVAGDDLAGQGCYILDGATAPEWSQDDFVIAYTARFLDQSLRPFLEERGEWTGRGFATIVNLDQIPPGWWRLAGVCLHEFAHWLDLPVPFDAPELATVGRTMMATWSHLPVAERSYFDATAPRWHLHGDRFVRACCHLAHRARRIDDSISPRHLRFSSPYVCFPEECWLSVLADELDYGGSIRELLDTEPPSEFRELWEDATGERL